MGNRVMDMQHIQTMLLAYLSHFDRERQGVVRILEQAVTADFYRVKMNPWRVERQTERPFITDKMHFMSSRGEFFTKSRSQDAAATNRWVTGDADVHWA